MLLGDCVEQVVGDWEIGDSHILLPPQKHLKIPINPLYTVMQLHPNLINIPLAHPNLMNLRGYLIRSISLKRRVLQTIVLIWDQVVLT